MQLTFFYVFCSGHYFKFMFLFIYYLFIYYFFI